MINEVKGNLLSVKTGHIMHGCNAHGVMGSGVAKCVKDTYPNVFNTYKKKCDTAKRVLTPIEHKHMTLGEVITCCENTSGGVLMIHNAITQYDYGTDSRKLDYEALCKCLENVNKFILENNDTDKVLNFPMIGAGLAGGNWSIIKVMIDEIIDDSILKFLWVYEG